MFHSQKNVAAETERESLEAEIVDSAGEVGVQA